MPSPQKSHFVRLAEQLREAGQAAREAEQAAEEAEQAAKETEQAGEQAEQALQEAKQARDLANQARHLAEQVTKQAEQALQEAEQGREQAEQSRKEAEQRREQAELLSRRTTLREFFQACHEHLHLALSVKTDKRWTTKGTLSVNDKYYPKHLKPWKSFSDDHAAILKALESMLQGLSTQRCFSPRIYMKTIGEEIRRSIGSVRDVEFYEMLAVETKVEAIIQYISENKHCVEQDDNLKEDMIFASHRNPLHESELEVQEGLWIQRLYHRASRKSPQLSDTHSNTKTDCSSGFKPIRTFPDQFCVLRNENGERKVLFIVEYKAPYKLSVGSLQRGFQEMDVEQHFLQVDVPAEEAEEEEYAVYHAKKLATAVATQTFHYMIENGLEYSYITTGEAYVFLRIDWNDPTTLFYHVAVPSDDVAMDDTGKDVLDFQRTAVSQVLGIYLLASQSEQRTQQDRKCAKAKLKMKQIDDEDILAHIPVNVRKTLRSPPCKAHDIGNTKNTPAVSRQTTECGKDSVEEPRPDIENDPDTSTDSGSAGATSGAAISSRVKSNDKDGASLKKDSSGSKGSNKEQHYCTQRCLLGIVRKSRIDEKCPNASLHPKHGRRHTINKQQFLNLVQKQLADDLDHNCEPLGLQGARGALFRITLASHGYVFVGKGTVQAFVPDLLHEGEMYRQLAKLQGAVIPVYLGNINLIEWYYLDVGVRILHMLLMSWGGEAIPTHETVQGWQDMEQEIRRTVAEVRRAGVDQSDETERNMLWNKELKRVMLIDFERAKYTGGVLQETSPNKGRKRAEAAK